MKQILLLLAVFLGLSHAGNAQDLIGLSKSKAGAALKKQFPDSRPAVTTDSIRLTLAGPADYILTFDGKGNCSAEIIITRCDSCYNGLLKNALSRKKYNWKKINENQYISRFEDKRMIEIFPDETRHQFSVLFVDWTREVYNMLIKE